MDYGVVVDLETTGLDASKDRIIEIGLVEFVATGSALPVMTGTYSGLEDPGMPLPEVIQKLTGLSDDVLRARQIDWLTVRSMLSRASMVVAHNADFDRGFLAQRPELRDLNLHWACSSRHINWRAHGFRTRALNYLAADHGFVNPFAHRALFDCATTFRLISPYLAELTARSWMREFSVLATGAPFEVKDLLRGRGYRWDPEQRVWWRRVFEDELESEREFLRTDIYKGAPRHREDEVRSGDSSAEAEDAPQVP